MNRFQSPISLRAMIKSLVKSKFRINLLSLLIAIAAIIIVLCILFLQPKSSPKLDFETINYSDLNIRKSPALSNEKLRQEILKLQAERQQIDNTMQQKNLSLLTSYGSFITVLVAVSGVFVTIWNMTNENARQRKLDRRQRRYEQDQKNQLQIEQERQREKEQDQKNQLQIEQERQREKEREQKEAESLRRLNEQFTLTVKDLGAEQTAVRASAAVSLMSFLRPESISLHEQVYWVLVANLKIEHDDQINRFLVRTFEKAIRLQLKQSLEKNRFFEIPLARAHLRQINLSNLDLSQTDLTQKARNVPSQIDLAFANLECANLTNAYLQRVRGIKVNLRKARLSEAKLTEARLQHANLEQAILHGTKLIAADLKYANLRGAQFQMAYLQSAHLDKTDLRGARFEQAYLADTYFLELKPPPDDDVLRSILRAHDWGKAHFNKNVHKRLIALSKKNYIPIDRLQASNNEM